ncbi:MAG: phage tail protein [Chloroflexota bacterium]
MVGQTSAGAGDKHYATYRFRVDISGREGVAEFSECGGLEMQVKFDEVREGGENRFVHRLPTRVEYGNLVLKRGLVKNNDFLTWCATIISRNQINRQNVTVHLVNPVDRTTVVSWTFLNAYPVKWSGPSLKAGENAFAVESLELAHEGLQIQ